MDNWVRRHQILEAAGLREMKFIWRQESEGGKKNGEGNWNGERSVGERNWDVVTKSSLSSSGPLCKKAIKESKRISGVMRKPREQNASQQGTLCTQNTHTQRGRRLEWQIVGVCSSWYISVSNLKLQCNQKIIKATAVIHYVRLKKGLFLSMVWTCL